MVDVLNVLEKQKGIQAMKEPPGKIALDSPVGKSLGFTSDKFDGWLWFTPDKKGIYISFIFSIQPNQGNLSKLFKAILDSGRRVIVPTPLGKMVNILQHLKFRLTLEWFEAVSEDVECWIKDPGDTRKEYRQ